MSVISLSAKSVCSGVIHLRESSLVGLLYATARTAYMLELFLFQRREVVRLIFVAVFSAEQAVGAACPGPFQYAGVVTCKCDQLAVVDMRRSSVLDHTASEIDHGMHCSQSLFLFPATVTACVRF